MIGGVSDLRWSGTLVIVKALVIALELCPARPLIGVVVARSRVVALLIGVVALWTWTALPTRVIAVALRSRRAAALSTRELFAFPVSTFKRTWLIDRSAGTVMDDYRDSC